jgi:type II secretory pathway component PulJ
VLTEQYLILYVCSAQNNTSRMTTEEERLARLRRVLHSLATRVPKVILTRVECTFPVLKNQAVSVKHSNVSLSVVILTLDFCMP